MKKLFADLWFLLTLGVLVLAGSACFAIVECHHEASPMELPEASALERRIQQALSTGDLQQARNVAFHWLQAVLRGLSKQASRQQLRQPKLWRALADVVERTSDHYLTELFWQGMDQVRPPALAPGAALPLMGVPIVNRPDLLERLLASLDHRVEVLAIVDNSRGTVSEQRVGDLLSRLEADGHPLVNRVAIAKPFGNAGVAASWNLVLRAFPEAQVALLVNNDVQFASGVIRQALELIGNQAGGFLPLLPAPQQFSGFLISADCWDRIGLFDPAFYPAYCEDLDYRDRLRAETSVRILEAAELQAQMQRINADTSATIKSDPALQAFNQSSFALNRLWYFSQRRIRRDPRGTWLRQWLTQWEA